MTVRGRQGLEADLLFVAGAGWTKEQTDGRSHVAEAEKLIRRSTMSTTETISRCPVH